MEQLCGHPTDRDLAMEMLTLWQDGPDLAGLRKPAGLERLAPDEQKGCLALRAELGAVLARFGNTPSSLPTGLSAASGGEGGIAHGQEAEVENACHGVILVTGSGRAIVSNGCPTSPAA
jgi:hypothetical protein